jgi:choline dehydrogenase-like flavoprotein
MPSVVGNLKSNKLTLQGHGVGTTPGLDVTMSVVANEFTMKMGDEVLMTVGKDSSDGLGAGIIDHDHDNDYADKDHEHLNFLKDVKFEKNVEIVSELKLKGQARITGNVRLNNYENLESLLRHEIEKNQRMEEMTLNTKLRDVDNMTYNDIINNNKEYDYVVIGSGPGGSAAVVTLAALGGNTTTQPGKEYLTQHKQCLLIEAGSRMYPRVIHQGPSQAIQNATYDIYRKMDNSYGGFDERTVEVLYTEDQVPKDVVFIRSYGGGANWSVGNAFWNVPKDYVYDVMPGVNWEEFDKAGVEVQSLIGKNPSKWTAPYIDSPFKIDMIKIFRSKTGRHYPDSDLNSQAYYLSQSSTFYTDKEKRIGRFIPYNSYACGQTSLYKTPSNQMRRTNTNAALQTITYEYDNLSILTDTQVEEIIWDKTTSPIRATHIKCSRLKDKPDGSTFLIKLKSDAKVCVSGGAVNSPALLQASGVCDRADLVEGVNLAFENRGVGKKFMNTMYTHNFPVWHQGLVLYSDHTMPTILANNPDYDGHTTESTGIDLVVKSRRYRTMSKFNMIHGTGYNTPGVNADTNTVVMGNNGNFVSINIFNSLKPSYQWSLDVLNNPDKIQEAIAKGQRISRESWPVLEGVGSSAEQVYNRPADAIPGETYTFSFEHTNLSGTGYVRIAQKERWWLNPRCKYGWFDTNPITGETMADIRSMVRSFRYWFDNIIMEMYNSNGAFGKNSPTMRYPWGNSKNKGLLGPVQKQNLKTGWSATDQPYYELIPAQLVYDHVNKKYVSDTANGVLTNYVKIIQSNPKTVENSGVVTFFPTTLANGEKRYEYVGLNPYTPEWDKDMDWVMSFAAFCVDGIHYAGSMSEAIDPKTFKINGTSNVYVADLFVFPQSVQANSQGWSAQIGRYVGKLMTGKIHPPAFPSAVYNTVYTGITIVVPDLTKPTVTANAYVKNSFDQGVGIIVEQNLSSTFSATPVSKLTLSHNLMKNNTFVGSVHTVTMQSEDKLIAELYPALKLPELPIQILGLKMIKIVETRTFSSDLSSFDFKAEYTLQDVSVVTPNILNIATSIGWSLSPQNTLLSPVVRFTKTTETLYSSPILDSDVPAAPNQFNFIGKYN